MLFCALICNLLPILITKHNLVFLDVIELGQLLYDLSCPNGHYKSFNERDFQYFSELYLFCSKNADLKYNKNNRI